MPAGAHHDLHRLQGKSFWFRGRNRLIQDFVREWFPEAGNVLEVGCGSGYVLGGLRAVLPSAKIVGSEISADGLSYAAARVSPPCQFLQMDARAIPYRNEFDLIGAFDVVEHIDEDEVVLAEIRRALRPHGGALFTVPQHPRLWSRADDIARHRRRYARRELADKLKRAGFVVLRDTSFVSVLLPVLAMQRWFSGRRREYDQRNEFLLPGRVDRLFEMSLDIERRVIRWGLDLPVGGSRIVAARRGA
jgi:SAM-dependent methyltransferase